MKIPLQEKIAELERRIVALEKSERITCTTTTNVRHGSGVDITQEFSGVWASVDALFKKAFGQK
jgi:hypothetical protein